MDDSDARDVQLAPHTTQVLSLKEFSREASQQDNQAGGVRVEYHGPSGAVMVAGSLANESIGYSANMPFWSHDATTVPAKTFELGSAGIMVGKPDPMMMPGFPAQTTFTPYLSLRNTTAKPLNVSFRLNYALTMGGTPINRQLPAQLLLPFESRIVEFEPMLRAAGLRSFDGMINLSASFTGHGGDLLLANGSVDQTGTYVFPVRPQVIGEGIGRISGYWSVADGNDAMFTLWNPTDQPQDIIATLYYGDGSGTYHLPMHLAPQASTTLDVGMLIMEKTPDRDGKVIPAGIREGSASFDTSGHDSAAADGKKKINLVLAGGVFNVAEATCGEICQYCNGYNNFILLPGPIDLTVGGSGTVVTHATDSYGSDQTFSGGSWTTTNSAVMTVNNGSVGGVNVGQVTLQNFLSNVDVYQGEFCVSDNMNDSCPEGNPNSSGGGNVFGITGVSPLPLVIGTTGLLTISGSGLSGKGTPTLNFDGAGISAVNPSVVNDNTIQAGYAVSCSAGPQSITVSFPSFDNVSTNAFPLSVALPAAPAATIQLAGQNISGTQSVVVGQQIALSASVSLPSCMTFSSQSWSIPPGTAVGGYVNAAGNGPPDTTGGQVAALPPTSTSDPLPLGYTFYWVSPGNSLNMSYQYTMSGGFGSVNSPVATAAFNVAGPTSVSVSVPPLGQWEINQTNSGFALDFGLGISPDIGIQFNGRATSPSGYTDTYWWVQLIGSDSSTYTAGSSTLNCTAGTGLDNTIPYATGLSTADSPSLGLPSADSKVTRSDSFTMYFMWRPGLTSDIPVPLGYVAWQIYGDAVQSGGTWTVQSDSTASANAFQASGSYPTWTSTVTNGGTKTCH